MKLGNLEAAAGEKTYGFFEIGQTHGRFPAHIPLHIVNGASDGPTLVVQAGANGLEIEPALILPQVVKELDPAQIKGALILAPLMNTSGFEFAQINSAWDDKRLNHVGRGRPDGTISEQLIHAYYQAAVANADALIDIRTGSQWSYHHFAGVYGQGAVDESKALAIALGLPHVMLDRSNDGSLANEAANDGIVAVTAYIGGGPGLRDYRERDLSRMRNAVLNAMRRLGMIEGAIQSDIDKVTVIARHTAIKQTGERGFVLMDKRLRGKQVQAGDLLGIVRHPFTGETAQEIRAPRAGIVVHGGASWPLPLEDTVLAILGDLVEEVAIA